MSRHLPCAIGVLLILLPCGGTAEPSSLPTLTEKEKADGWKLLFDGKTAAPWRGLGMDTMPTCWVVQDGYLKCLGGAKEANDLVTPAKYENFEFAFEWMFPKGKGNSGVKYRVQEQKGKGYAFGPEYQCFGDPKIDIHSSGSLYDLIAPQGAKLAEAGQFNQGRIIVQGSKLEHWLNGVKVVEAEFGSEALTALLSKSHFKNTDWGKELKGHIVLQNHHNEVFFRNLKIRELPATPAK